ncbi:DUF192 domain-containing protein [Erythrobacter litoralis]|uniref:DUF192 domain-containing protein n=1 Tax=Erythrobacter litoralis TaxID=39960 RepID=UPI0024353CEA|nr:DUF192 domain-containing protein [Erythrobacter litoralis]MDG6077951.1 DUF192 domain-containing protein [Erythrobacter litoralis]
MGRRSIGFGLRTAGLSAAFLALAACSPQAQTANATQSSNAPAEASVHPVSGLSVIPLTVTSGNTVHRFQAELADTPAAQQRGLMFRTELGPNEGMIFPSNPQTARSFWMKNTPLPLDIIFIGPDRRILNIAAETPPYTEESVSSEGITSGVLELIGGRAAELGLEPGDKVDW